MDGRQTGSMEVNDIEIIDVEGESNEVHMTGQAEEHMQGDRAMHARQNEQAGGSKARGYYGPPPPRSARQMSLSRSTLEIKSSELMEETRGIVIESTDLEMFVADLATAQVLQVCPTTMAFENKFGSLVDNGNGKKK